MNLKVDEQISLELIEEKHISSIFEMVDQNRNHLRPWLPFVDRMQTVEFAGNFVNGTMQRNMDGQEYAFVIFFNDQMVGRIGIYKIDPQNRIGEIGYWITENEQGKGIVTKSCRSLIDYGFNELLLNRIEIRCGTENLRSQRIPKKLGFKKEGIIRQGEWLYNHFIDLNLYSILKEEWE